MNESDTPQLKVSPMSIDFDLKDNDSQDETIIIANTSGANMDYKIYVEPYYVDESYNPVFTVENDYTKLANWINFENDAGEYAQEISGTLVAGEEKEIKCKISMPSDANSVSQYAMIFVESEDSNTENIGGVIINSRIGIPVSGDIVVNSETGDNENSTIAAGEIGTVDFANFMLSGDVKIGTSVKNPNTVAINATERVTVKNIFGAELYNVENITEIMPETTREIAVDWEATPIFGILNVEYSISAGGDATTGSQTVIKMPVAIIVAGILVVLALIFSLIKVLHDHKKLTGKYFSFRNNREKSQSHQNRLKKIHLPKNPKKNRHS